MTGQQLKNSILQLAVQGKLVPQDPADEPASQLLARIREEKEQLIREKMIKREKNPSEIFRGDDGHFYERVGKNAPVCIDEELPFEIPEKWEWARFSNLVHYSMGKTPPRKEDIYWKSPSYPWVSIGDLVANGIVTSTKESVNEYAFNNTFKSNIAKAGTLLMSFKLTVGKVSILGIDALHNEAIISIFPFLDKDNITRNFLFCFLPLLSQNGDTKSAIKGTTLNSASLDRLLIPVPPLMEQERICTRFKHLILPLTNYTDVEKKLSTLNRTFPDQLKKSILQEAIQGNLVAQNPADEPASALLERIRTEKKQLIKDGKIKREKNPSHIFRGEDGHFYERVGNNEPVCIDDQLPFEIPESWEWCRLGAILTSTEAGKSPQCDDRPRTGEKWGVIKTTAIQNGYFLSNQNKVLPNNFNVQDSMIIHQGDLLITRAGPRNRTGVICIVEENPKNLILSDKTVRLSYLRGFLDPKYVMLALSTPAMQDIISQSMTGMAASQVNISQSKMKTFLVPLPPLSEQQRIVDKLKQLNVFVTQLSKL